MSKVDELKKYEDALVKAKNSGNITDEGMATLNAIQEGAWNSPEIANYLQAATINTSDEVGAWIRSYFTPGLEYDDALSIEKAGMEQAPKGARSLVESVIGSAPTIALTRGRMVNLTSGALYGGGYAYGGSESDPNLLSAKRLPDAALGAVTGAVITPITDLALKPITNLSSNVKNIISGPKRLGQIQARKLIQEAIENDAQSVEEAILYVINKNNSGKPYTLADLGENQRALLDATNILPGKGKNVTTKFLKDRNAGILTRLTSDLQDAFGSKANFYNEFNALKDNRIVTGNKLYERAYRNRIRISPELEALLKRPSIQNAFNRALGIAAEEGNQVSLSINNKGQIVNRRGNIVKAVPTRFMHLIKRGLDDEIGFGKSIASNQGQELVNASKSTRKELLNILDDQNKSYKIARNFWAGNMQVADAMELGNDFLKLKVNDLSNEIFDMSLSELEGFRLGAMQGIIDEIERGSETTAVSRLLKSPARRRLIKMTFPQTEAGGKAADKFLERLYDEVIMLETSRGVLGNSLTVKRGEAVRVIREGAEREPVVGLVDIVSKAIRKDFKNIQSEQEAEVADQVSRILTENNPAQLNLIKKELNQKGIKFVAQKYLKDAAPRILSSLINPQQAAARAGTFAGQQNFGSVLNAPIQFGNILAQQLMGNNQ